MTLSYSHQAVHVILKMHSYNWIYTLRPTSTYPLSLPQPLNHWTQESALPFPGRVSVNQSFEGLNTTKDRGRENLPLFLPYWWSWAICHRLPLDWKIYHQSPWLLGLQTCNALYQRLPWESSLQSVGHAPKIKKASAP